MTKSEYVNLMVRMGKQDSKLDELLGGQKVQNGRLGKHDDYISDIMKKLSEERLENAIKAGEAKEKERLWRTTAIILGLVISFLSIVAASGCWHIVCPK